jgi:hypothetical protein
LSETGLAGIALQAKAPGDCRPEELWCGSLELALTESPGGSPGRPGRAPSGATFTAALCLPSASSRASAGGHARPR